MGGKLQKAHDMCVIKENDLIQCASYDLTTIEQKMFCYVISKIKPTDKEFQRYEISALEFAEICGINKKNVYREFKKMASDFNTKARWIKIGNSEILFSPFSEAECNQKKGSISVILNSRLKKYLIDIGGIHGQYTKYELWNILSLKTKHSIRLYELFKSYSYQFEKDFDIDELKGLLCVENYKNYSELNRCVLTKAVKEINLCTDLEVSYTAKKEGKEHKVKKITFKIQKKEIDEKITAFCESIDRINKKKKQVKGQVSIFDYEMEKEIKCAEEVKVTPAD